METTLLLRERIWQNQSARKVRKTELGKETLFFVLFFLCVLFSSSKTTLYIAAIGIVLYFINMFRFDNVFLWKYVPMVFANSFYLLGVFVCDVNPVYLSELDVTTYYTGAFQSLVLYNWCFFSTLKIVDRYTTQHLKKRNAIIRIDSLNITKWLSRYGATIVFMFGMILFLPIASKPAFKLGVSRFNYIKEYMPHLLSRLASYPTYLCPLLICPLIQNFKISTKKKALKILVAYIPYLAFLIWSGNKFGKIWALFYSIAIPLMFAYGNRVIKLKGFLLPIGLGILLTGSVIGYHMMRGISFLDAVGRLLWRTSAQGELWWKVFQLKSGHELEVEKSLEELYSIFQTIVTRGAVRNQGIYRLMKMLGDPVTVKKYLDVSMRFSAGGFELPFYYYKYFSFFLLPVLICPFYSALTNSYIKSVLNGEYMTAIASLQLLLVFQGIVGQGDWYNLVAIDTLFFLCVIVVTGLLHKGYYSRRA